MSKESEIRDLIKKIAGKTGVLVFRASVVSIDQQICTIDVSGLKIPDVKLCVFNNDETSNYLITPEINSLVVVADLSGGELRDLVVIACQQASKITYSSELIINEGKNGGMVKVQELTDSINKLVDAFNNHTHNVSTTGTAAAQTGTAAPIITKTQRLNKSEFENEKVKH
jgi:hypothetical protein